MNRNEITVSAPGRLCLLGEHQDYLGLPILAAAINKRIYIKGKKRKDFLFRIQLPDIDEKEEFLLEKELIYRKKRDYLKELLSLSC